MGENRLRVDPGTLAGDDFCPGRTAAIGAILIIVVMPGGLGTHLVFDNGRHMTSEIVPLTLATLVLAQRWKQLSLKRQGD